MTRKKPTARGGTGGGNFGLADSQPARALRPDRVAELVRQELAMIMLTGMEDKRVRMATVSEVHLSPDLRNARVKVSATGTERERILVVAALKHATGFLQAQLGSKLSLRHIPRLKFELDRTIEYSVHVQTLINEGKSNTSGRPPRANQHVESAAP